MKLGQLGGHIGAEMPTEGGIGGRRKLFRKMFEYLQTTFYRIPRFSVGWVGMRLLGGKK
jgi:hypothetical protein